MPFGAAPVLAGGQPLPGEVEEAHRSCATLGAVASRSRHAVTPARRVRPAPALPGREQPAGEHQHRVDRRSASTMISTMPDDDLGREVALLAVDEEVVRGRRCR